MHIRSLHAPWRGKKNDEYNSILPSPISQSIPQRSSRNLAIRKTPQPFYVAFYVPPLKPEPPNPNGTTAFLRHSHEPASKRKNQMQRRTSLEFIFRSHLIVRPVCTQVSQHLISLRVGLYVCPATPLQIFFLATHFTLIYQSKSKAKQKQSKAKGRKKRENGEKEGGQTFASHQISTSAARVECLLFLRHVPLCATPIPPPRF